VEYFKLFLDIYEMYPIGKEEALYLIMYFSELMTEHERVALRHTQSTFKLEGVKKPHLVNMYYKQGWLTTDPEILNLLKDGEDQFVINSAERILRETPEKVFLNLCPKCGKLARTPQAKQCRFCEEDWH
jgi:hypothetical protein